MEARANPGKGTIPREKARTTRRSITCALIRAVWAERIRREDAGSLGSHPRMEGRKKDGRDSVQERENRGCSTLLLLIMISCSDPDGGASNPAHDDPSHDDPDPDPFTPYCDRQCLCCVVKGTSDQGWYQANPNPGGLACLCKAERGTCGACIA
ncbi:unnamed protein product [Zymoseptoria tritici ST99CH_3D7]|uniref:Uncharacterized protein n=1 Tax=Zymoseptoria tritici (strain ST99CH_3D7) TaxID=1276538 RepID=A0A1X7S6U4_ZYMT9|nr:unnamed protein product [Zymoseptoria tritici ST99CH_3D7]